MQPIPPDLQRWFPDQNEQGPLRVPGMAIEALVDLYVIAAGSDADGAPVATTAVPQLARVLTRSHPWPLAQEPRGFEPLKLSKAVQDAMPSFAARGLQCLVARDVRASGEHVGLGGTYERLAQTLMGLYDTVPVGFATDEVGAHACWPAG